MLVLLVGSVSALCIALILSYIFIPVGKRLGLVDEPFLLTRKIHRKPMALVGGFGIFFAVVFVLVGTNFFAPEFLPQLGFKKWIALLVASISIFLIGTLDDLLNLRPRFQIIGPVFAALTLCFSGVVVTTVTNPLGGIISFMQFPLFAAIITFMWLMGMMYSTKLLDGLDGLSTGLSGIGALIIFALTQTNQYFEPHVGFVALVFAGACFGFLIINFHPARAFLGEGGSVFLGFGLAVLAILSGSKIATTLLVMGLPVIDVIRLVISRMLRGFPITQGDNQHLHHLFLANGFSQPMAVLLYYGVGCVFGILALFLQSKGKILLLGLLILFAIIIAEILQRRLRQV
jgi:UDP-GlcNAc:undecaprenyl-phosphate/decaprenyl-phosphate GlcNAc-1-phosphate transferase